MSNLPNSNEYRRRSCFSTTPSSAATGSLGVNYSEKSIFSFGQHLTTDVAKNTETKVQPLCATRNDRVKYPLTEKSKRDTAAMIRAERERQSEQIRKTNEKIARGVEVLKNHTKQTYVRKIDSLKRINDNQYHNGANYVYNQDSSSFNVKIEALEHNLRKLKEELIMEKNRLTNADDHSVVNSSRSNCMSDEATINVNIARDDETVKTDFTNSIERFDEPKFVDKYSSDVYAYETAQNVETRLHFSPGRIEFEVTETNGTRCVSKRRITVSNRSRNTVVLCRYSHLYDPNTALGDNIKVKPADWCRLQPGKATVYLVMFAPLELSNSLPFQRLQGVKLMFETVDDRRRPNVKKYAFHIPIEFCVARPKPELVTKTITFHDSNETINLKKFLILKNNGNANCVFSVIKEDECQSSHDIGGRRSFADNIKNSQHMFKDIIISLIHKMFNYFMWKNHCNVLLPAKGSVKVPVVFNHNLAYSTVSERYIIKFDKIAEWTIPNLRVTVIGHVKDEIRVTPDVFDVGLCYLTSSVQVANFCLHNDGRVVVPFEVEIPQKLSKQVELSPSKGYLGSGSTFEINVRLRLNYDILRSDACKTYFDVARGVLEFPVWVRESNRRRRRQVRVLANVVAPHSLRLIPETLDFGTVNTMETVVRSVMLANHSRAAMEYGFLNLPKKIAVLPSAFGTIFSGENICLHIHYSPSAKDLPRDVHTFEDNFVLKCNTITGLNADNCLSEVTTTAQTHESVIKDSSFTNEIQESTVENELDHGPDKIKIRTLQNTPVQINSLEENIILKEAIVVCHARIHDIPVELSVQKVIFGETHFTSYSIFKIELRGTNLDSLIKRNVNSFPGFKIRFEFVSNNSSIEFKPKNGILHSNEVIQICIIFRPKLNSEHQNIYEDCLNSLTTNISVSHILDDTISFLNKIYRNEPLLHEQIKIFEANRKFYSSMMAETKIFSAVCFVQFLDTFSAEYFGFDTGSLKLSLVCPTTRPNIILLSDRIDFGTCTTDVRHDEWLLVLNVTRRPVPLKISLPDPTGPFFCPFAINVNVQSIFPGQAVPVKVSFTPEREMTENETLEITSGLTRLAVKLCGTGLRPSCKITPNDIYNVIHIDREHLKSEFIFQVTNTCARGTNVRVDVQLEWTKELLEPLTADAFAEHLRRAENLRFDGPDWTCLDKAGDDVFDLGNGGRPLRLHLDADGSPHYVQVVFKRPRQTEEDDADMLVNELCIADDGDNYCNTNGRVYVAKMNVHVGQFLLRWFYVFGFAEITS